MPPGHDQLPLRELPQALCDLKRKSLHGTFLVDVRIKEMHPQ
jgi:hypothetical protein